MEKHRSFPRFADAAPRKLNFEGRITGALASLAAIAFGILVAVVFLHLIGKL